ncbi:Single-stranded DNA-binding protein ssb [compost metagenome]
MNDLVLIGKLVYDPELKFMPNVGTPYCKVILAVEKITKYEKATEFFPIFIYGKMAENTCTYMVKGSTIGVDGRLSSKSKKLEAGEGYSYELFIVAKRVEFLSKGAKPVYTGAEDSQPTSSNNSYNQKQPKTEVKPNKASVDNFGFGASTTGNLGTSFDDEAEAKILGDIPF